MRTEGSKIHVYDFSDFRAYLKSWFAHAKATRRGYSYRVFASKAGFATSNFLLLVIQGRRNLSADSIKKVAMAIGLNHNEEEFFRHLVFFNQAKTHHDKNDYYRRLLQSKKFGELKPIERRQYAYYSTWYHPVVRELVASSACDGTPEWLAARLSPAITPAQAAKSVQLLEDLGLIRKTTDGRYEQTSTILSTGPQLTSVVVHAYHKILLDLSQDVMDRLSMVHRDVSSLTLGVAKERIPQLKEKIRAFRKDILQLVSGDTRPEEVFLLNMQFYPVTHVAATEGVSS